MPSSGSFSELHTLLMMLGRVPLQLFSKYLTVFHRLGSLFSSLILRDCLSKTYFFIATAYDVIYLISWCSVCCEEASLKWTNCWSVIFVFLPLEVKIESSFITHVNWLTKSGWCRKQITENDKCTLRPSLTLPSSRELGYPLALTWMLKMKRSYRAKWWSWELELQL